ncbi:mucin-17-like, partial [Teleopsis dalmanni]|uniref:mucin-17-like n=1 Tax=Teleopsis dalmanni TaxID=139649 RepID=UPI0018CF0EF4
MPQFMHFGTFSKIVTTILISQIIILTILTTKTQAGVIRTSEIASDNSNDKTLEAISARKNDPDIVGNGAATNLEVRNTSTSEGITKPETTKLNNLSHGSTVVVNGSEKRMLLKAVRGDDESTTKAAIFSHNSKNDTISGNVQNISHMYSIDSGLVWNDNLETTSVTPVEITTENVLVEIEELAVKHTQDKKGVTTAENTTINTPIEVKHTDQIAMLHSTELSDNSQEATTFTTKKVDKSALDSMQTESPPVKPTIQVALSSNETTVIPQATQIITTTASTVSKVNISNPNEESNEIHIHNINTTAVKRAKFINDNSTNAQQMNLPDAAEVWSLAGMKTVPKMNHSSVESQLTAPLSVKTAFMEKDLHSDFNNVNDSDSHSEKNLLDWTQIMLNTDLVTKMKTKDNLVLLNKSEDTTTTTTTTAQPISTQVNDITNIVSGYNSLSNISSPTTATTLYNSTSLTTNLPTVLFATSTVSTPESITVTTAILSADITDKKELISKNFPTPSSSVEETTLETISNTQTETTLKRVDDELKEHINVANTLQWQQPTTTTTSAVPQQITTLEQHTTAATVIVTLPDNHSKNTESDIIKSKSNLLDLTSSTPATTQTDGSQNEVNIFKVQKKNNNNEGGGVVMTNANEHDNTYAHNVTTLEHSLTETTTLSLLPTGKVVASANETRFGLNENLQTLKDKNNDVEDGVTVEPAISTTTETILPTVLAKNETILTTTEINNQIGNQLDLDKKENKQENKQAPSDSVTDLISTKTILAETTTEKTTTISSHENELLIFTTKTATTGTTPATTTLAITVATKTTPIPTVTTFSPSLPTIATIGSILETGEASTKVTPVRINNVDVVEEETTTAKITTTGQILNNTSTDSKDASIETNNVIDTLDKPLTTTKTTATTTGAQDKITADDKLVETQSNSLAESDNSFDKDINNKENKDEEKLLTDITTTTMNSASSTTTTTAAPTTTTTSTTTTTIPTTESPLINLLDHTTTKPATTTPVPITTKTEDIYKIIATTTTTTAPLTTAQTTNIPPTISTISPDDIPITTTANLPITTTLNIPTTVASTSVPITTVATTITSFKMLPTSSNDVVGMPPVNTIPPDHTLAGGNIQHSSPTDGNESDVNVIIAITVSIVGVIALILLVAFLYLMRKRQKQMSYGQRCRPVSMDAYSLDNVSVLGSVRRKGAAMRASKRSFGNAAFDDPSLKHNALNATELIKFVDRRSSIFEEFRDVPQIIARPDEVPPGCEDKNRYANVIPLPETRVILQQQHNDVKTEYINANYVRGPKDAPNYYIACQAPLEATITDFWRMIWEQQSRVIIQATDLIENGSEKCAEYLPPSVTLDNHTTFGDFQVTLKNREVKEKYAISTLILKNTLKDASRELTHYWYKWPETGVPNEEAPIIAMLLEARSSLKSYAIEQANELKGKSSTATLRSEANGIVGNGIDELKDVSNISGSSTGTNSSNGEINGNITTDKFKVTTNKHQGPLTVHCSPGTGRTGTIISCDVAIRSLETPKRIVDIPQIVYYIRRGRASAVQTKEQYEFIYKVANMYATKITN